MLDFHVGRLIVSCGPCLWWFGGSNLGVGCEQFKAHWVGSKTLEVILRVALEGPNETFDNVNEEAIVLWENGTGSIIMLILHVICILQVMFFVQQL
jgi:hypothetical protein